LLGASESITDISVMKIAECCPDLNALEVGFCPNLTDISMLKVFDCFPHINRLNIFRCFNITDSIYNKFRSKGTKVYPYTLNFWAS
jgi:F-box and leucine-rich repeat protein GRR1